MTNGMTFDLGHLFFGGVIYLLLLFLIAYSAEQGWLPNRLVHHPVTYVLSLGVYATAWSFYGSVGFAQREGYLFATIYLGVTLAFLLAPVLLAPILRLIRDYQLTSLADLFAFRYRSQVAGILVTLFMLAGTLPYIALQIRAVTESVQVLTQEATPATLALGFCVTVTLFAILFGARHISPREKHEGLVVAIAFESLVKLTALLGVGLYAVFGVFGGLDRMDQWLAQHPEQLEALYRPVQDGPWATLLLLAFAAAFLLPRQFHMTFTENLDQRALGTASWGFPLFLLLFNLAILPILWAGTQMQPTADPDYYALGITLHSHTRLLPALAFLGGISAASAMVIVTTLALAAMCLNHLLLPVSYPDPRLDLYRWLLWGRRMLIALIILTGYGFYLVLEHNEGLVQLGLISFVAVAQFLPGVAGLLFWPRATRFGFLSGLVGGGLVWATSLLLPLLHRSGFIQTPVDLMAAVGATQEDPWAFSTFWSLAINALLFVGGSLLTRPSPEEREAASACCRDTVAPLAGVVLTATSPEQFKQRLVPLMGEEAAEQEVRQALSDLRMDPEERRPSQLRRLRERIERNLSGLMGPLLARMIVDDRLQMNPSARTALADNIRFLEDRLEVSRSRLQGLAAELDGLRRYHRQILQDLPLGVCSVGPDQEVVSWNLAMSYLSGVSGREATGLQLAQLPAPWGRLLSGFAEREDNHLHKVQTEVEGQRHWLNLHKASFEDPSNPEQSGGTVILVEDLTELQTLEAELAHSERLASIGRLAAGVAHEIGNPVTGIACLAQNLRSEVEQAEVRDTVDQILGQTNRISRILQSLMGFSHSGAGQSDEPQAVNLDHCVQEAIDLVRLGPLGKQMDYQVQCDPALTVSGDPQHLQQMLVNLLGNARDASAPGSPILIGAKRVGDMVEVEVIDHGGGMHPEVLERIFEPFFTTKQPGEGTGLGLALVYSIVRDHGGTISVQSRPGRGTGVSIRLPLTGTGEALLGEAAEEPANP